MLDNKNSAGNLYRERQYFSGWVYLLLAFILFVSMSAFSGVDLPEKNRILIIPAILLGIAATLLLSINVFRMDIDLSNEALYVRFGILFPMIWKTFLLTDIAETRVVQYRPIRDAGGWGWRHGRIEKKKAWFFNAKGNQGVLLVTAKGDYYVIGSQQPHALKVALDNASGV